jgi:signal transduction histidine kinase
MSQSRATDAASPGVRPAQRGAGASPAPRNWRLASRLIVLVAIPTMLGLALTGLRVTGSMRSAEAYGQVGRVAVLGQEVNGLAQAMEDERADTAAFIADGRPAAGLTTLRRQYVITDSRAGAVRRLARQVGRDGPAGTRAGAASVLASIADLPDLRRYAAQGQAPALAVIDRYSTATAGLFPVSDGIAELSGNPTLMTSGHALAALSRMKDQASEQQAILGVALAEGRFAPGVRTALISSQAQQASDLVTFRALATPEESWALSTTLASPLAGQAQAVEQRAAAAGPGALVLGAPASRQWGDGMSFTVGWMRHAEQQLAAWNAGYGRSLQRSAMEYAIITGAVALAILVIVLLATMILARSLLRPVRRPADAGSALEITEMARAFDRAHREALRLAGEAAGQHRSISAVSAGFFRRSHSLLERLLRLLDSLELSEDDPGRLASLFQIDHLATRMRRNSDSALVLAGHETARPWAEPATLVDVLRAAVSEIDQYGRVVLDIQPGVSVSGSAVADTVHLLAELLENATEFSPRTTQVIVSAHPARGGSLISITDGGTGLPEEHLGQLNWQLAHPSPADAAVNRHMGLFAVAHLAARHGITVALKQPPGGGTTAEVYLPATLISPDTAPGRWPAPAGEGLRARGGGARDRGGAMDRAGARDRGAVPLSSAPRFADGRERVRGLETGTSGAMRLALGAPLPPPVPLAAFAVGLPEPEPEPEPERGERESREPGGALPIYESVESDYPHPFGRDLPQPSGPQAALPQRIPRARLASGTAAAQPPQPAASAESAEITREQLASFQRGSRRARAADRGGDRIDRDPDQPAQDR